jgi:oligopeptide transport system substrate-binding protein
MDYNDPINMLELLRSDISYNYGRFNNAEFDKLIRESATIQDLKARSDVLHKAEAIAMDNFGVLPIYYYVSKNVVSPKIKGYDTNAKDIHRTRWITKSE